MKAYPILLIALCASCASLSSTTGEPGIAMGDSYEKVLETVKRNNRITKTIEGDGIRAEGYSSLTKDCRIKYFIFEDKDGLQQVEFEPAPNLSPSNNCQ
jgi:hypothetical protein